MFSWFSWKFIFNKFSSKFSLKVLTKSLLNIHRINFNSKFHWFKITSKINYHEVSSSFLQFSLISIIVQCLIKTHFNTYLNTRFDFRVIYNFLSILLLQLMKTYRRKPPMRSKGLLEYSEVQCIKYPCITI